MKVSFDYDGTLSTSKGADLARKLMAQGDTLYIVTARLSVQGSPVYKRAQELGIPPNRVHFTEGRDKWPTLKQLGVDVHYDNNPKQINSIEQNTDIKAVLFTS